MASSDSEDEEMSPIRLEERKREDTIFSLCMSVRNTPLFIRLMDENPDIDPFYIKGHNEMSIFENACRSPKVDGSVVRKCLERGHKNSASFYRGLKDCLYHGNIEAGLALFSDRSWDIFEDIFFYEYTDYNALTYACDYKRGWFTRKAIFDDFPGVLDYFREKRPTHPVVSNPVKYVFEAGLYNSEPVVLAAYLYAQVIFLCDDLLRVLPTPENKTPNSKVRYERKTRFFEIARRLPMELQMVLCNTVYGLGKSTIPSKFTEPAFQHLASLYHAEK